jgi:hypothetical protein
VSLSTLPHVHRFGRRQDDNDPSVTGAVHNLHVKVVAADVGQAEYLAERRLRLQIVVLGHAAAQDQRPSALGALSKRPPVIRAAS